MSARWFLHAAVMAHWETEASHLVEGQGHYRARMSWSLFCGPFAADALPVYFVARASSIGQDGLKGRYPVKRCSTVGSSVVFLPAKKTGRQRGLEKSNFLRESVC